MSRNVRLSVSHSMRFCVEGDVGLEQTGFLFLGPKACCLGGFVEDMCDRITSSVAIPRAGTDGGMVAGVARCFV